MTNTNTPTTPTNKDVQQVAQNLVEKHATDEQFKQDFKQDPKAAVEKHFGPDALDKVKEHLDSGKIQDALKGAAETGKTDVSKVVSNITSFFKK